MKLLLSFISSLILVVFLAFSSSAFADSQINSSSSVLKVKGYRFSERLLLPYLCVAASYRLAVGLTATSYAKRLIWLLPCDN
ncbi:hypothetical protein ACIQXW_08135 [Lysinibacillus sp. NPDC097162]|uniref:hypothetical protein n=1 Tax=Lysinibacillus sp. NPDC097162 TaxID=3364140 RepID=UPI0038277A48